MPQKNMPLTEVRLVLPVCSDWHLLPLFELGRRAWGTDTLPVFITFISCLKIFFQLISFLYFSRPLWQHQIIVNFCTNWFLTFVWILPFIRSLSQLYHIGNLSKLMLLLGLQFFFLKLLRSIRFNHYFYSNYYYLKNNSIHLNLGLPSHTLLL